MRKIIMPNYPFLILNEKKIRTCFLVCEKDAKRSRVFKALDAQPDMHRLMQDSQFCQELVECLFHIEIIKIFGGYHNLLLLPSVPCNLTTAYIKLPVNFIPDNAIDIAITMDGADHQHCRPLLAIRVVSTADKKSEAFISCHPRYSFDMADHWISGANNFHPQINSSFFDDFNTVNSKVFFSCLEKLVNGEVVKDNEDILSVYCPFAEKQRLIRDRAATKIQAAFRGHSTIMAYKSYKQHQRELQALTRRTGEAIAQGRFTESTTLLESIPQLTAKFKAAGSKLKL